MNLQEYLEIISTAAFSPPSNYVGTKRPDLPGGFTSSANPKKKRKYNKKQQGLIPIQERPVVA